MLRLAMSPTREEKESEGRARFTKDFLVLFYSGSSSRMAQIQICKLQEKKHRKAFRPLYPTPSPFPLFNPNERGMKDVEFFFQWIIPLLLFQAWRGGGGVVGMGVTLNDPPWYRKYKM